MSANPRTTKISQDPLGRRASKTHTTEEATTTHRYLYDDQNIVAILNEEQELLATILHHPDKTDTPLSITNHQTNQTYYYHRDHQGSIIALTNEEGQIAERITYDGHFGEIMEHTKHEITHNPYGYTGREMDTLRLYYYRARYYSPILRRFLSPDPIEHASGDYNWYRYVGNDPVNRVDPSGLKPDPDKLYICTSSSFRESFHAFDCAGGVCGGLYPNPNKPYILGIGAGYVKDDTKDFDNPDFECKELDQSKPTCNKKGFKTCMQKFVNTRGVSNHYPYNYLTHNCRTTAGGVALYCQIKNHCW